MAYERKEFKGNAAPTTLSVGIDNAILSIVVADATNWPTGGANGKFVICINRGQPTEEKILCTSRTGTTITASARGHDSTTAAAHTSGQAVEHVLDAETIDQVNRLANLMTTKGDVVAFNGTNPVRLGTGAVDASMDGKVLQLSFAAPTGLQFATLTAIRLDTAAPAPAGVIRLWYDQTHKMILVSDGSNWLIPVQFPSFASAGARNSFFGTPSAGHACHRSDIGVVEYYDGTIWRPADRPRFASTGARDAYYTAPWDGAVAYLTSSHDEQTYRNGEWITTSQKVTIADTQPLAGMQTGDMWLQPVD